jgi:hypothetical protein
MIAQHAVDFLAGVRHMAAVSPIDRRKFFARMKVVERDGLPPLE